MIKKEEEVVVEFTLKKMYLENGVVVRTRKECVVAGMLDKEKMYAIMSALGEHVYVENVETV